MLNDYCTEKLLGLKDLILLNIDNFNDSNVIEFKIEQSIHICPRCGNETSKVHDYRIQDIKDIPAFGRQTILRIHKRRYVCKHCGKRFYEKINFLPKFQCILTDPNKHKVLDILPERTIESLSGYFTGFTDRKNVKYVVMDMSSLFRSMAQSCFPKAKIIADKYHVYRQVQWAFEDVRKEEQKKFSKTRRQYFKRSRTLLLKAREKLTADEFEQISHMLSISKPLAQA